MSTRLFGLASFSDRELLLLLTNPGALFQDPKNASKLIGFDVQTKKRILELMARNKIPATEAEFGKRVGKAMQVVTNKVIYTDTYGNPV